MKKYIIIELERDMTCPQLVNRVYEEDYSYSNKAEALKKAKLYRVESKNRCDNKIYAVVTSGFNFDNYQWMNQTFPKVSKDDCIYIAD